MKVLSPTSSVVPLITPVVALIEIGVIRRKSWGSSKNSRVNELMATFFLPNNSVTVPQNKEGLQVFPSSVMNACALTGMLHLPIRAAVLWKATSSCMHLHVIVSRAI